MDIEKSGKFLNIAVKIMVLFFIAIPLCFIISSVNMDKLTPDVFVSVKIEGKPELKRLPSQSEPILNQEAIKIWLMQGMNEIFNWNSTDYSQVMKRSAYFFDTKFYQTFSNSNNARINGLLSTGVQISSSIVQDRPVLVATTRINGIQFWKYYLTTSTVYKSEYKTVVVKHEIVATVKAEDPKLYKRGVVIVNLNIR